jgi:putative oxidoreductase
VGESGGSMKRGIMTLLRLAVGVLFVTAGGLKALDPALFALDVQNYRLVPWTVAAGAALYLPWLEIVCGAALIFGRATRGALWIITALMFVFIGALISAGMRGLDVSCGCFGHGPDPHGVAMPLVRDFGIVAALTILLFAEHRRAGGVRPSP